MTKTTVVCLAKEQEQSLQILKSLSCVHIVHVQPPASPALEELHRTHTKLTGAIHALDAIAENARGAQRVDSACRSWSDSAACCRELTETLETQNRLTAELQQLESQIALFEPWGNFDFTTIQRLEKRGWHCMLCIAGKSDALSLPEETTVLCVREDKSHRNLLLLSRNSLADRKLPEAVLPRDTTLQELQAQRLALKARLQVISSSLAAFATDGMPLLQQELQRLTDAIVFESAKSGMGGNQKGTLVYLTGYTPVSTVDALRQAAIDHGWALRCEEIADDDMEVPTKLVLPKPFRMAQLVLDFIGVLPGYHEIDVSVSVFICLSLFCGMLVGDAGYGTLFSLACLSVLCRKSTSAKGRMAAVLLLCMSLCIVLWGALSGTWFGLKAGGISWLANDDNGDHVKLLCFLIGAAHLSFAHLWKAVCCPSLRDRIGNIGWAIFMWANFFTVKALLIDGSFSHFTMPLWLYGIGFLLVLVCGINWHSFGDVIYSPFNFINSVSDVLSYIRLYAVGLSSLYIADAFNDMSRSIWSVNPWLIPVGIVVVLAGHALNIGLSVMGVLVHGTRLNTLEFSGHIGLEWSGREYLPFK